MADALDLPSYETWSVGKKLLGKETGSNMYIYLFIYILYLYVYLYLYLYSYLYFFGLYVFMYIGPLVFGKFGLAPSDCFSQAKG